jgi:hypothetical protein
MQLKPNNVKEFTRTIENEIIPLLRKQKGFHSWVLNSFQLLITS